MLGVPSMTSMSSSPAEETRGEANSFRYTPPAIPIGAATMIEAIVSCSEPMIAFEIPGSGSSGLLKMNWPDRYGTP